MHLAGLVLGSGAPARLRASGAAPLAAPGGHSLGEERGRGGERVREATRKDLGAGTGIFITPVISLLRARLRSFPSPAALSTLRPVRGGSLAVPGAGVWRREEMGEGEWEGKRGGGKLHPDARRARTRATHPGSSHAPHGRLHWGQRGAKFSPARAPGLLQGAAPGVGACNAQ